MQLIKKLEYFKQQTKTHKSLQLVIITTSGLHDNAWSEELIEFNVTLSMPFLAALAGVAGLALLLGASCAIVKIAKCGKSKDNYEPVDDWVEVPKDHKQPSTLVQIHDSPIEGPQSQQQGSSSSQNPAPSSSLGSGRASKGKS